VKSWPPPPPFDFFAIIYLLYYHAAQRMSILILPAFTIRSSCRSAFTAGGMSAHALLPFASCKLIPSYYLFTAAAMR